MPWGVGPDELVAGAGKGACEHRGAVAGSVVGDDPGEPGDAVRGEECLRAIDETDCCDAFLIGEGFGVGEAGEGSAARIGDSG